MWRRKESRLEAVFGKLAAAMPGAQLGAGKPGAADVGEPVLREQADSCTSEPFAPRDPDPDRGPCLSAPSLSRRLECEVRAAKRGHLSCGEVLLPCGLLRRVARDVLAMAESEPCGLRGCLIYLHFETDDGEGHRQPMATVRCDPATAATFELTLTLKRAPDTWNFIPQFIKNLARGGTIVVSPAYVLSKKKLYRSILE